MELSENRNDIPILLLYNIDPSWPSEDILDRQIITQKLFDALVEVGHPVQEVRIHTNEMESALEGFNPNEYLVFNWCEEIPGIMHSEPLVAQCLEQLGFTFTAASASTLTCSQDKRLAKRRLRRRGIPTPAWQVYTSAQKSDWSRFPAIVKPAFEHCSFGISRESVVQSTAELIQRVCYVLEALQQPALVEDFIDGREFHVGVIGNTFLDMLPPAEIDYSYFGDIHDRLCTYESNFDKHSLAYLVTVPSLPVSLTEDQLRRLEMIVTAAYRTMSCRDYARMDIRLKDEVFYVLDVNPNPDISPDTSLVRAAQIAGWSYGQLGSLFVNLAAQRHPVFGEFLRVERTRI